MRDIHELSARQRQQFVDTRQVYDVYREAMDRRQHSFQGSMRWLKRGGTDYLHRKIKSTERSLGPRSPETERAYEGFITGRQQNAERLKSLSGELDRLAPLNRVLNLGRVPRLTARILRRLDDHQLLGQHILLVGTNALYAYEAAAGVQLRSPLLATGDADLLWDARQRVALLLPEVRRKGLISVLNKVDKSFALVGRQPTFRAANRHGFLVDLIRPEDRDFMRPQPRTSLGVDTPDLDGAPIHGLQWLINTPRFEAVAIGEDGYPVRIVSPDPRAFALHKLWISERSDRDPVKAGRDKEQAQAAATIAQVYLGLQFDDEVLRSLPNALRTQVADVVAEGSHKPNW